MEKINMQNEMKSSKANAINKLPEQLYRVPAYVCCFSAVSCFQAG